MCMKAGRGVYVFWDSCGGGGEGGSGVGVLKAAPRVRVLAHLTNRTNIIIQIIII